MNIKRRVAIVGAGLTLFRRRLKETTEELCYHAAKAALDSAGLELKDVDCVVYGSAPDAFDGLHMKGENAVNGAGACLRPFVRNYVGGATGVTTPITGWYHVASGLHDICLVVGEEKMSNCHPHPQAAFRNIFDNIMERPLGANLVWIFALEMSRYMHVHNIKKEKIALVSVKNKGNALDHPSAQLPAKITVEDVLKSETMVWPVQRLDVSPTSDGAAAVVLASEEAARKITDTPVWISGVGWNIDSTHWTNRDLYFPEYVARAGRMAYKMARITNPRKQIHVAEVYDPFSYKELHHLEGLGFCGKGEAPRITEEGITQRDGDLPVNPSGGLLGVGNPIAAAGVMKVCEIFWQLRKEAGRRQVRRKAETGLAQSWGGLMQFGAVMTMKT
ncbi:MAG: thiolase domain-containing protein [Candidatus Bathyarchaeia archaeon]